MLPDDLYDSAEARLWPRIGRPVKHNLADWPDHLVGRFNSHQRQCSFLFADEAYTVEDRAAAGRLKRLITEPTLSIEGKGKDIITVPNCLHVMMASNEDWVVPAGEIERRYEVQTVANDHAQDPAWFEPLCAVEQRRPRSNALRVVAP